jgi:hypothetical protein
MESIKALSHINWMLVHQPPWRLSSKEHEPRILKTVPSVKDNSTIAARGGETSIKSPVSLFGPLIQLWIVCREIPSAAAISALGHPLVRVRAIIARRSSSVCRGFLIFESPSALKTQRYETHVSGTRPPVN